MDISKLSRFEQESLLKNLDALQEQIKYNKIDQFFTETGKNSRENYKKHLSFCNAGQKYRQRAIIGGNRTGKSLLGAYETTLHLTGLYPDWWEGHRFNKPVKIWVCTPSSKQQIEGIQQHLLGSYGSYGSGLISKTLLEGEPTKMQGVQLAVQHIFVKHLSGGTSQITFKTYNQELEEFMGAEIDLCLFDEEPPSMVYKECLMRMLTTKGHALGTFTPFEGYTDVVKSFLYQGRFPKNEEEMEKLGKFCLNLNWNDAPHLDEDAKREMEANLTPAEIEYKKYGYPSVGPGKVYQVTEESIKVTPFEIPVYWPRTYGLTVTKNMTAAVFAAYDKKTDIWYVYDEYLHKGDAPVYHSAALRRRGGKWMEGAVDVSKIGTARKDDIYRILDEYYEEGLTLHHSNVQLEAGIREVYDRLATGRLKFFNHLEQVFTEIRTYKRLENDKINPEAEDEVLDAVRALVTSGLELAKVEPDPDARDDNSYSYLDRSRNPVTGY